MLPLVEPLVSARLVEDVLPLTGKHRYFLINIKIYVAHPADLLVSLSWGHEGVAVVEYWQLFLDVACPYLVLLLFFSIVLGALKVREDQDHKAEDAEVAKHYHGCR